MTWPSSRPAQTDAFTRDCGHSVGLRPSHSLFLTTTGERTEGTPGETLYTEPVKFHRLLLIALLSTLCATVGFVYPALSPLVFVGFVPLVAALMSLEGLERGPLIAVGIVVGATLSGASFYPIFWHILPIDWAGLEGGEARATVFGIWVYSMALGALGMAFFPYVYGVLKTGGLADVILLPCIWVLFESLSEIVFAVGVYQPLIAFSPYLSLGALNKVGHLATDDPGILQVASVGGSFGLSFVVLWVNAALAHAALSYARGRSLRGPVRALGGLVALWVASWVSLPPRATLNDPGLSVALISTRSPMLTPHDSAEDPAFVKRIGTLVSDAADASVIILPEGTNALTPELRRAVRSRVPPQGTLVLDSRAVQDPNTGRLRRELEVWDPSRRVSSMRYKRFLVPVGEYLPLSFRVIARLFGGGALVARVGEVRRYESGPAALPVTTRHGTLGVHFCEEILSPTLYQEDVSRGADVLVNVASHAWYHDSNTVFERMKRAAQVRAAESRRFMLVSSDASPSFVLDAHGRTVAQSAWGVEGVLRAPVRRLQGRTVYAWLGPQVLLFPLLFCVWALRRRVGTSRGTSGTHPRSLRRS